MITPEQKFTDELEAKKFKGHKADRAANTDKVVKKLDELKPSNDAITALLDRVETIKGDKGDKGETGEKGDQGIQGEKGDKGDQGEQGIQGKQGLKGDTGKAGKDGTDGRDGIDGLTGPQGKAGKNGKDGDIKVFAEKIQPKLDSIQTEFQRSVSMLPRTFDGLYDTNFKGVTNGQVPTYDSASKKWIPGTGGGGGASIGGTITGGTAGSVLFVNPDATIAQDNANFFWDDTNNRLGIGTTTPSSALEVNGDIIAGDASYGVQFGNPGNSGPRFNVGTPGNYPAFFVLGAYNSSNNLDTKTRDFRIFSTADSTGFNFVAASGNIGIGSTTASAKVHIIKTTEQLRLGYDASNYFSTTVGSTGSTTFDLAGTSPEFTFNKNTNVIGSLKFGGTSGLSESSGAITITSTVIGTATFTVDAGNGYFLYAYGFNRAALYQPTVNFRIRSGEQWAWSSDATDVVNTADTGLKRSSAGVVKVTDGSTGSGAITASTFNGVALTTSGGTTNFLRADGTYAAPPGGSGSGITRVVSSVAINTSAGATAVTDYVYIVTATATITLPTAVGNTNQYTIKCGAGTTTIATTSAQTIDGSASAVLSVANSSLTLISDNANWRII